MALVEANKGPVVEMVLIYHRDYNREVLTVLDMSVLLAMLPVVENPVPIIAEVDKTGDGGQHPHKRNAPSRHRC